MGLNEMIERIQEKCTEQSVITIGIDGCGGADFIIDGTNNEITNK